MFVRFQERKSDGRRPGGYWPIVEAKLACTGACRGGEPAFIDPAKQEAERPKWTRVSRGARQCGFSGISDWRPPKYWHCKAKPRCRWRIGTESGLNLAPYTLNVSLVENRRVSGKVRQEHIADLGSIEGELLPAFWAASDPAAADAARLKEWTYISTQARAGFWERLEGKLTRLSNRITEDEAAAVRAAIEARIPNPPPDELRQMMARREVTGWQSDAKAWRSQVTHNEKQIADLRDRIANYEEGLAVLKPFADQIDQTANAMQRAAEEGDHETVLSKREERIRETSVLGSFLAARLSGGANVPGLWEESNKPDESA